MNPEYEMAFNAKINRARSFDVNSAEGAKVKEELMKMLKDEKNVDYLDQIYYALASTLIKKDTTKGFNYLQQSVSTSPTNTNQKGISYIGHGRNQIRKKELQGCSKIVSTVLQRSSNRLS